MATATITEREQWLEQRRLGIGGSDAASLFPDDSKYGCPTRLWYEKRNQRPDYERTEAEKRVLERGIRFEDKVADLFAEEYGFKLRRQPSRVMPGNPHMRVNIDRQIIGVTTEELLVHWPNMETDLRAAIGDGPCGPGVLEVKTSNHWVTRDIESRGIVPDYAIQVQHALAVTGYKWGVMAVMDTSSLELMCFPMVRNELMIKILIERADSFWALVENGPKPPAPDFPEGKNCCRSCIFRKTCRGEQYLMQLAGEKPDTDYVSDDSFAELASDLKEIIGQKDLILATEETVKQRIKERMESSGIAKLEVPSVGAKVRWTENKPPYKWDTKGLEAEAAQIGRYLHFVQWLEQRDPELLARLTSEFQHAHPNSPSLAAKYKSFGAPTRPFVFVSL